MSRDEGPGNFVGGPLASDLHWVLVEESTGAVQPLRPDALAKAGLSVGEALEHAAANHHRAWNQERFKVGFGRSPEGVRYGVADGGWLAPAALLSPAFYELISQNLGSDELVAIVPNEELLLVVPNRPEWVGSAHLARLIEDGRRHPRPVSEARLLLNGGFPSELVALRRPEPVSAHTIDDRGPAAPESAMSIAQHIEQIGLLLVAAIAILGGSLQMVLGQPDTSPRLDNVHRFMAGVYLSTGLICLWAALTIQSQGVLVYLLALGVLLAGIGRLVSIAKVGLPEPAAVWLGYLIPELLLPFVIAGAHFARA